MKWSVESSGLWSGECGVEWLVEWGVRSGVVCGVECGLCVGSGVGRAGAVPLSGVGVRSGVEWSGL